MKFSDIIQWNCRGVKNKRLEMQILADQCKAQVICLQETKLSPNEIYTFSGFEVFTKNRNIDPQGIAHGGVAILAQKTVAPIPIRLNTNFQAIAISVKLHKRVTICSIYIPPGPTGDFTERELDELLKQLPRPYLLLGDVNAHNSLWYDRSTCGRGKKIERMLLENECYVLDEDKDTHVYSNGQRYLSSHIDISIASLDLLLDFEWGCYGDLMRSDHYPVWIRAGRRSRPRRFPKWVIEKADWNKFEKEAVPRMEADEFDSAREMAQYATSFIIGAADEAIPKTSGKGRSYSAVWFNEECIEAKKRRQDKLKEWKDGTATRAEWQLKVAQAQRVFQREKRRSWKDFIEGISEGDSIKDSWRKIGILKNSHKSKDVTALKVGGRIIDDPQEIADNIARRIEDVSSETSCSPEFLRYKRLAEKKKINFSSRQNKEYNDPLTKQELDAQLKELKDSATGPDGVHNRMLKNLPEEAKDYLLKLMNKIWLDGEFPEEWRLAHIIPLLKEGKDPLDPASYRPISLTSCICKLLEKIVARRLAWFLEPSGLIDLAQNGSRKGRSPIDSLVALEEEIHGAFLRNRLLASLFIDLTLAYDTSWDYLILKELHDAGLRGNLGVFIANFMKERKFQVRVGDKLSAVHKLELGVPQGSVLSGTLFIVAVNTVIRYIPTSVSRSLYLDDMRFSIEVHNLRTADTTLNGLCRRLVTWMSVTGFRISLTKTKVLVFHRRPNGPNARNPVLDFALEIRLQGVLLEVVRDYKFLGLIFDQRLTWVLQIARLKRSCMKALGAIKVMAKNSRRTKREMFIRVYKALVLPKLDYGSQVYGTASEGLLKTLDPIHHAALRTCSGAFRTSNRYSLYVETFVPSLWDRREFLNLCYMFRSQRISSDDRLCAWEDDSLDVRYSRLKRKPKSFGFLVRKSCIELDLQKPSIKRLRSYNIPPWQMSRLDVCFELGKHAKLDTEEVFRQIFREHQHEADIQVYTDGSKKDEKVGAGVCIQGDGVNMEISEPLGEFASVFTAELVAIRIALVNLRDKNRVSVVIYSDSRSALQALLRYQSDNVLIQDIQELVYELTINTVKVMFCWVPSHVGIKGNEKADSLAKAALNMERQGAATVFFSDFRGHIKSKLYHRWREQWIDMVDDRLTQLREVQDFIRPRKWEVELTRMEDIKITRLRIGHTRFARDYYFTGMDEPECIECGEVLTVKHVLLDCGNFYHERREHFGEGGQTLTSLLGVPGNFKNILNFFKAIDFYDKI